MDDKQTTWCGVFLSRHGSGILLGAANFELKIWTVNFPDNHGRKGIKRQVPSVHLGSRLVSLRFGHLMRPAC
ncbi:hypothetical protein VTH06DRAFT_3543 [Thermothelomyces fergusii]